MIVDKATNSKANCFFLFSVSMKNGNLFLEAVEKRLYFQEMETFDYKWALLDKGVPEAPPSSPSPSSSSSPGARHSALLVEDPTSGGSSLFYSSSLSRNFVSLRLFWTTGI